MNQQLIHHVPFHAETLLVIEDHLGNRFVAMKPIVEALGLSWVGQLQRIKRDPVLDENCVLMHTVAEDGKDREMVVIEEHMFQGWLFTISTSRVKPELRERLDMYRRECFDVLHSYFTEGAAWNPRFHRQEFDRSAKRIAGKQTMDMAPVAFSAISRAAERVAPHQCVEFAHQALDLANQCLSRGEPDPHAQEHLLKLILSTGETLHPDEVSALTRTTPTQRGKLLRQLERSEFQVRKNLDGHYEHVKPVARSAWLGFGAPDHEGGGRINPDA